MSGWANEEHIDALKALHKQGLSASQIAFAINRQFRDASYTRNGIVGKAHRLGLGPIGGGAASAPVASGVRKRASVKAAKAAAPKPLAPPKVIDLAAASAVREDAAAAPTPQELTRAFVPMEGRDPVALLDLGAGMCRWPVGEAAGIATFCGGPVGSGPYCTGHAVRARQALKPGAARSGNELMRQLRRYA